MGLLGDIFSGIDTQKRRLAGLLSDPVETIRQKVAQFGEDQGGLLNLQANAYPMAGDRTVLNSPEQIASFRRELADAGANQAMQAATVWHGSPHKFDKFDSSKIGTGEGMQAYGHGLYLADAPDVAKGYQTKLSQMTNVLDGEVTRDLGASVVGNQLKQFGGDAAKTKQYFQAKAAQYEKMGASYKPALTQADQYRSFADQVDAISGKSFEYNTGSLYKVDLPDEHIAKMLDWDKPLSQQPQVIEALANHPTLGKQSAGWRGAPDGAFENAMSAPSRTGEWLYRELMGNTPASATQLRQQGIPGIRYLDGGSRGTGQGTSNYVVFPGNESLLQILERNGVPIK
jgi:hypothetical protein